MNATSPAPERGIRRQRRRPRHAHRTRNHGHHPTASLVLIAATRRHEWPQPLGGKQQCLSGRIAQDRLGEADIGQVQRPTMRPAGIE